MAGPAAAVKVRAFAPADEVERMRSEPAEPRPAPLPNPMVLLQRVRQLDCVFSVLAAMVATLIALGQVYYDGPVFGTASDFLAAFLWAFSVKAMTMPNIVSIETETTAKKTVFQTARHHCGSIAK